MGQRKPASFYACEEIKIKKLNGIFYDSFNYALCGIDPSIRQTGFFVIFIKDGRCKISYKIINPRTVSHDPYTKSDVMTRMNMASHVARCIKTAMCNIPHSYMRKCGIENYSFGSKGRAMVHLGEFGGILRLILAEGDYGILEMPPKQIRKQLLGNGNATKENAQRAIKRVFGVDVCTDVADAGMVALALIDKGMVRNYEKFLRRIRGGRG